MYYSTKEMKKKKNIYKKIHTNFQYQTQFFNTDNIIQRFQRKNFKIIDNSKYKVWFGLWC
jgi:hypothetical protein